MSDLFGLPNLGGLGRDFVQDALGASPFDDTAAVLRVGPALWKDYRDAAEAVAELVTGDPAILAAAVGNKLDEQPRAFVEQLGRRAYRRALTEDEVVSHLALLQSAPALYPELEPFTAFVRANVSAFLQSPHFLYRAALGAARPGDLPRDDWEVASLLSYAIWNSMPDAELFRAAAAGELHTEANVRAQVERLLDAPRAAPAIAHFFSQLYQSAQYARISKDATAFPQASPALAADMQGELSRFTGEVFRNGGGVRQLLTSTTTFVTPPLAAIYGVAASDLPAPDADGFSRIQLRGAERAGLLTLSGFLAWKAGETEPSTIARGVFVARRVLCQALGNPPPTAQGATLGAQPTDRLRVEALTGAGTCGAGCHDRYINPLGFSFEHYGALGEYRRADGGLPIDAAASYPLASGSASFTDVTELAPLLAEDAQAHGCFASFMLQAVLGREPGDAERALKDELVQASLGGASLRQQLALAVTRAALQRLPSEGGRG